MSLQMAVYVAEVIDGQNKSHVPETIRLHKMQHLDDDYQKPGNASNIFVQSPFRNSVQQCH